MPPLVIAWIVVAVLAFLFVAAVSAGHFLNELHKLYRQPPKDRDLW